ncbi:WecB/TagA/CpsF family glycosyltransferase [Vibrio navarrensis]|uniref:WecB/TagA/CpsF family glycosyltransferase n=1 Tax=Vibrio navarrensis TaxID=29495 RepID=UPI0015585774|nr:WecB/TagA/CpsF family glycosyltransferase [Vibrio navarrensis]
MEKSNSCKNIDKLIAKLEFVGHDEDVNELSRKVLFGKETKTVSFLNYHAINLANENLNMLDALLGSNFLLRDGIGVKKLLDWCEHPSGLNMNGTDFIPLMMEHCKSRGYGFVVFGGNSENNIECTNRLVANGFDVLVSKDGYCEDLYYLNEISSLEQCSKKIAIILGMGMPRQEILAEKIKSRYPNSGFVIFSGGAIIDRLSGKVKRGPDILVRNNLEWLYRFYSNPRRLFRRVVLGGTKFCYSVFRYYISCEK